MSATNWAQCPRCKKLALEKKAELDAAAIAGYGTLPVAEFDALRAEAAKPFSFESTVREDYEVWIDGDGLFHMYYRGDCQKCDFIFEVKDAPVDTGALR